MNFKDILFTILQQTPQRKEHSIVSLSKRIDNCLFQLDELQKMKKQSQQKHLYEAFIKLMQKMGEQLREAKKKYENIDKEQMKQQKCIQLAKDIKIFKEECFYLRERLSKARKDLKSIKIQNQLLRQQKSLLEESYQKKSREKDTVKYKTLSTFFGKKNHRGFDSSIQNQSSLQQKVMGPRSCSKQKNLSRLVSTSQEQRTKKSNTNLYQSQSFKRFNRRKKGNISIFQD